MDIGFKKFLHERELDLDFISSAEKCSSFNLSSSHFTSLERKEEIQHLIGKLWFPEFNDFLEGNIEINSLNKRINTLKSMSSANFKQLFEYNIKGVGPGEALLFFIHNDVYLGGGSSAGIDAIVNGKPYEIKAVKLSKDGWLYDFKLGGTVNLTDVMADLKNLAGAKTNEIKGSWMAELARDHAKEYNDIQEKFRNEAFEYFKDHEFIFFNNNGSGEVVYIGRIARDQIFMERVTSGTLKPLGKVLC